MTSYQQAGPPVPPVNHNDVEKVLDHQSRPAASSYGGSVLQQQDYREPQYQQTVETYRTDPSPRYDTYDVHDPMPAPPKYEHEPAMGGEACCVLITHMLVVLTYFMVGCLYGIVGCKWTFVESLYFSSVTITTVGYGDYGAHNCKGNNGNKTGHMVFFIFFILFGLATVASIIASVSAFVSTYMAKGRSGLDLDGKNDSEYDRCPQKGDHVMLVRYQQRTDMNGLTGEVVAELDEGYEVRMDATGDECSIRVEHLEIMFEGAARNDVEQQYARASKKELDKARVEWFKVVGASFLTLAALVTVGAIFYCVNEDWSIIDGVYWSFTTITTIGYGAFPKPNSEGQMKFNHESSELFSVFYILIAVSMLGAAIGSMGSAWTTVKYKQKKVDMLHRKLKAEDFQHMDDATRILPGAHTGMDAGEYLAYWLCEEGVCDQHTCFHYLRSFYRLDVHNNGVLGHADLVRLCGKAYTRPGTNNRKYLRDSGDYGYQAQPSSAYVPQPGAYEQSGAQYQEAQHYPEYSQQQMQ